MSNKKVLMTIDNVRIKEYDKLNVMIERHEEVFIPKEKKTIKKWRFNSYANSILSALMIIQSKELLIDKNAVTDLKSYLKAVRESNEKLVNSVANLLREGEDHD